MVTGPDLIAASAHAAKIVKETFPGGFKAWIIGTRVSREARDLLRRLIMNLLAGQVSVQLVKSPTPLRREADFFLAVDGFVQSWFEECKERNLRARLTKKVEGELLLRLMPLFRRLDQDILHYYLVRSSPPRP